MAFNRPIVGFSLFCPIILIGILLYILYLFKNDVSEPSAIIPFQPVYRPDMFQPEKFGSVRHFLFENTVIFHSFGVIFPHNAFQRGFFSHKFCPERTIGGAYVLVHHSNRFHNPVNLPTILSHIFFTILKRSRRRNFFRKFFHFLGRYVAA